MPLLGGLFKRTTTSATSSTDSIDGDYVIPDKSLYNLPSSSKLKLPFRRNNKPDGAVHDTQPLKKSPPLFSWTRERTKSKPPPPPPLEQPSFNLNAFHHVRTPSPTEPLLPPPRPRPRGDSIASDSSQRISVAAFREAQARSRTNSPVPSFRPSSTADTLRVDTSSRNRASTVSVVSVQPSKNTIARSDPSASDSSSDNSDSEDDDQDVDSDGQPIPKPARNRTITRRRINGVPPLPRHVDRLSQSNSPNQSDRPPFTRQRASVSASASTPNVAARSASVLAATNSSPTSRVQSTIPFHKPRDDSDPSTDSDGEDMPLSDLVAPRRPGSSASNYSNSRPRMPSKPLIDINTLAGGPPLLTPILRHEHSLKIIKGKEPDVEKDQPFSIPAALALPCSPSPISPSATRPTSTAPNHKSSADVPVPTTSNDDDDLVNAIRLVGTLDKELHQPSAPALKPHSSNRIVPTPIREREPPTSFTVLSRPAQRQSTAETSASFSPASQTRTISSPPLSPQLETRQRASTQKDKSDTLSITSAAQSSTSRTSRIPPVPLIHSIPDSPSVKEGLKPGRPRATSHTSQPAASSSTSSKMLSHGLPQRPFASNSSIAGESPAGSSTGDSSSGRSPFTPRDGSDIGVRSKGDTSDADSTLKARGHVKKPSVTFEDQLTQRTKTDLTGEQRTRERRRSEAKAALELGKIVNGRGPYDSDEDMGTQGRNPTINVTMENGAHGAMQPSWSTWQQPMATGMGPMTPPQFSNDPAFLAAHQRALFIAKQAYQMAVAQHAMQMAGEEWERGSNVGFGSGGSVYGGGSGGSVYGGGSGGSVYGGTSGGSVYGGMVPMAMMSMHNMGMLMPPNQWAARSSVAFPSAGSVYGGMSASQSEYGGAGGWGTRSVYGDSFGPPSSRSNIGGSNNTASAYGGGPRPRAWTGVAQPSTSSPPRSSAVSGKTPARNRAAPPSSWKNGR